VLRQRRFHPAARTVLSFPDRSLCPPFRFVKALHHYTQKKTPHVADKTKIFSKTGINLAGAANMPQMRQPR